ncbi:protein phosphatase 1 regulatory subunit 3C-like [Dendronephthya gigantea]|uniref:protein phosphatase 1 regulatory subunit 3C-like n=1 Tax=Dendronephthya gigantea TaxID=151771 RepID=UPI00106BEBAD|nr:protein phosphatase 1 regulatory subunit 3C-like [Dendronephthya gigantea]
MMATATASRNFKWTEQPRDLFKQFSCNNKPARTIRPNSSFPKITRSLSFGSPTFPRRKPSPIRHKSKSVHFADSKGLDLVSVLTFSEENELREQFSKIVCPSVGGRQRRGHDSYRSKKSNDSRVDKLSENLIRQLAWQKVCVEKTELEKTGHIRGEVFVANLAFEKQVKARFTLDSWQTHDEIEGEFLSNCTKDVDRFVFKIPIPRDDAIKKFKVEFAVSYTVLGDTFWDNNNGFNYHVLLPTHK